MLLLQLLQSCYISLVTRLRALVSAVLQIMQQLIHLLYEVLGKYYNARYTYECHILMHHLSTCFVVDNLHECYETVWFERLFLELKESMLACEEVVLVWGRWGGTGVRGVRVRHILCRRVLAPPPPSCYSGWYHQLAASPTAVICFWFLFRLSLSLSLTDSSKNLSFFSSKGNRFCL